MTRDEGGLRGVDRSSVGALSASLAAAASALCCVGTVAYLVLGAGGAVALAELVPARPYLVAGSLLLLVLAVWSIRRHSTRCSVRARRINHVLVSLAAIAVGAAPVLPGWVS